MISKLDESKIEKIIWNLLKYVKDLCDYDFMSEEEFIDNINYNY